MGFHSSKEDSRALRIAHRLSCLPGFHSSKEDSRGRYPPRSTKIEKSFHSSKEDSRGLYASCGRASQYVSIPQRKIQEETHTRELCGSSEFPFLKGRFKRGWCRWIRAPMNRFHSSKEDSRVDLFGSGSYFSFTVSIPQRKIQEASGSSAIFFSIAFPFLKGRFKRVLLGDGYVFTRMFPFLKGRFKSHVLVPLHGMEGGFPFLKGRFKREGRVPDSVYASLGFHSSKEDSRGATSTNPCPLGPPVSIPQRKIQEAIQAAGILRDDAVSIPQRKIQEGVWECLYIWKDLCFHSSKEDSRAPRSEPAAVNAAMFPFLKGRFKRRSSRPTRRPSSSVSIPQRKIQERRAACPSSRLRGSFHSSKEDSRASGSAARPTSGRSFHSSKEDSRVAGLECKTCPHTSFHSSKEDSRAPGAVSIFLRATRFHSSKEDSRGTYGR